MDGKEGGTGGSGQHPWASLNTTSELAQDMQFNHSHVVTIIIYSVLMVISSVGNLTVLTLLVKRRRASRASRLDFLLMHLAIADLLVTFLMMPLEIGWAWTVRWMAGDPMCRIMMFARTFGLYLSSYVLVCISFDRYYAVLKPMCVTSERRARLTLCAAWLASAASSAPQSLIFHVDTHPNVKWYDQCVVYGSLPTRTHEFLYFLLNMTLMYVLPLATTCFCYASVFVEIVKKTKGNTDTEKVRRSGHGVYGRARTKTLKMTITILIVFFTCWTPYYSYCIWWWIDMTSANQTDPALQKALWMFSCTNSCANPIVYGLFNIRSRRDTKRAYSTNGTQRIRPSIQYRESMELSVASLSKARSSINDFNGK